MHLFIHRFAPLAFVMVCYLLARMLPAPARRRSNQVKVIDCSRTASRLVQVMPRSASSPVNLNDCAAIDRVMMAAGESSLVQ
jgi:hypothetical protein